ncbi:PKD domain-containing protein [Planctomycetota bacterium]
MHNKIKTGKNLKCNKIRRILGFWLVICLLTAVNSQAAIYYCDPDNGNTETGDGSAGNPWGSLESIASVGTYSDYVPGKWETEPIPDGSTIKLMSGYHGELICDTLTNGGQFQTFNKIPENIIIEAADGEDPKLLSVRLWSGWTLRGVTVSPDYHPNGIQPSEGLYDKIIALGSDSLVENCNVWMVEDKWPDNSNNWDNYHYYGIHSGGSNSTIRNNTVKNVWSGINTGAGGLAENNLIQYFTHDGIRTQGPDSIVQDNRILDNIPYPDHSDGVQIAGANGQNITIQRNYINARSDPDREWTSGDGLQGIFMATDGELSGVIQNNVILVTSSAHGITANEASSVTTWPKDLTIVNNTILRTYADGDEPWANAWANICLDCDPQYTMSNVVVRNNISDGVTISPETYDVETSNNVDISNYNLNVEFVDYANGNVNLAPGSSFIDAGTDTDAPSTDILGNPRDATPDIGAYEYVSSPGGNQVPIADAGGDQTITDSDENGSEQVTLDGSQSTDSDGTIQSYVWSESGTQITTGANPNVTLSTGQHTITLTVTDDDGAPDTDTLTVTVNGSANQAPTANAGSGQTVTDSDGNGSEQVTLNGSGSSDSDGTIQSYVWSESGTQITTGVNPNTTLSTGQHTITLTVTDDDGATDTDTVTVTVNEPANQAPIANAGSDQTVTDSDDNGSEQVTLNGSGSSDSDGTIQSYIWSEASTPIATGISPNVTFSNSEHTITLTVTDDDGATDTDTVAVTINAFDIVAPSVTNLSPAADSIQAPLNSLIYLDVTDSGKGVDASTVTIEINGNLVYTGDTAEYNSSFGICQRIGTSAAYRYIYQADETFDYDQTITVAVNATDLGSNVMDEYSYSFATEMRSFGKNLKVNTVNSSHSTPATIKASNGDVWVVWEAENSGVRDIYVGKSTYGTDTFGDSVNITNNDSAQSAPAIAIDSIDRLYVAWQDYRNGEWDIYMSTSTDGITWSAARKVSDPNSDQTRPAMAIDNADKTYIAWQDNQNDNNDIYIASSSNLFVTKATAQITSNASSQTSPAIAITAANRVYLLWEDNRAGTSDIYGADSSNGSWTNVAVVSKAGAQISPVIATEASGEVLHFVWVDNAPGDNDIYYASSTGLPGSAVTGSSIIDDATNADQLEPAITVAGSTGNNLKVFTCWKDERNVSNDNSDTDIYSLEANSGSGTNVLIGDDGTNSAQSNPAIGIDGYEHPYIVFSDGRNVSTDIYFAGSSFLAPTTLDSENLSSLLGTIIGIILDNITNMTDVSVTIPANASQHDVNITISKVLNPPNIALSNYTAFYDFGPSGIEFDQPVTIVIPYDSTTISGTPDAYWYNPLTGMLSQQGITDVETIEISSTLSVLRFQTTHFTQFLVGDGIVAAAGGGGGCSMSLNSQGSIVEFLLPYIGLTVVMTILKLQDKRKKKMHDIAKSE